MNSAPVHPIAWKYLTLTGGLFQTYPPTDPVLPAPWSLLNKADTEQMKLHRPNPTYTTKKSVDGLLSRLIDQTDYKGYISGKHLKNGKRLLTIYSCKEKLTVIINFFIGDAPQSLLTLVCTRFNYRSIDKSLLLLVISLKNNTSFLIYRMLSWSW